jgi:N-acetylmuramic acid 6-phosphate etherase
MTDNKDKPFMLTEHSNPHTRDIDRRSALEVVQTMNAEDRLVADAVQRALPQIAEAVEGIAEQLGRGGHLYYVGAGTSGRLGVLDAVECVPTFGTPPELVRGIIAGGERAFIRAVEGAEDNRDLACRDMAALKLTPDDVVVGIAASGRTPYVLEAVAYANEIGALTVGISCNEPAPLLDLPQISIPIPVGPEVIAGSTRLKAGTAQKMVLNMLSTGAMIRRGKVYGNLMVDVQVTNEKLAQRARRIAAEIGGVDEDRAAELLRETGNSVKTAIVMARRGVDVGTARRLLDEAGGHLHTVIG